MSTLGEILNKNIGFSSITIGPEFAKMEFRPEEGDREAAWDMYVELLTRVATQPLDEDNGNEQATLESLYSLFPITRTILKEKGRSAKQFTQIAIIVLNKILRPFTSKWHGLSLCGAFKDPAQCLLFRSELKEIQGALRGYARILAEMAKVDDLTNLFPD